MTNDLAISLTRAQVYDILVGQMGWEPEDVTAFWRVAKRLRS